MTGRDRKMDELSETMTKMLKVSLSNNVVVVQLFQSIFLMFPFINYPLMKLERYTLRPNKKNMYVRPSFQPSVHPHFFSAWNHISVPIGQI